MERLAKLAKQQARTKWGSAWNLLPVEQQKTEEVMQAVSIITSNEENEGYQKAAQLLNDVLAK